MDFIFRITVTDPLRNLYLLGLWEGKPTDMICAELTGVDGGHWLMNPEVCESLLERKTDAFVAIVLTLGYFGGLTYVAMRWLVCSPMWRAVRRLSREIRWGVVEP